MNLRQCRLRSTGTRLLGAVLCASLAACAEAPAKPPSQTDEEPPAVEAEFVHKADEERVRALEREVDRLKADLVRAEDALVTVESRLQSSYSRANTVSSLAEAHMQLNKASGIAPWQSHKIEEAQHKLDIAQKQIDNEYFGAAMFFIYRANRIVEELNYEVKLVETTPQTMFINRPRVNLRSGPSTEDEVLTVLAKGAPVIRETRQDDWILIRTLTGFVGWVYHSLVTSKERYKP
ncbi:MAG: SH3 domain-containing protein [Arenicellales bacterium]